MNPQNTTPPVPAVATCPEAPALNLRAEDVILPALFYIAAAVLVSAVLRRLGLHVDPDVATPPDPRDDALRQTWTVAAGNLAQVAGLAGCLLVASRRAAAGAAGWFLARMSLKRAAAFILGGFAVAMLTSYPAYWATQVLIHLAQPDYKVESHRVVELLRGGILPSVAVLTLWLGAVIVAPLCEEAFFRGIVQPALANWTSRGVAIAASAVIFGAAHPQLHAIPPLIVLGVVLGVLYERTRSVLIPAAVHALFNLATMLAVALGWT
ncbi:MAG: CPBP family intramembrane metalloprotease [Phycisphaerae bacterium]|nr:MAG: CPBP family intramembrane metalloprotease [Planctomycetota bacterium]KAB2946370.1 MAG: CPBP family intramembrane metalloprotease [Phycisphaerae bacterium]MBE7457263.1 CPBP family intramembrane metalloprotease [Planctomycetia bacterium]MCL4719128.1 CPBP family intramembrane metalloprotease [Phycisphaerae bacterium]MCQ3921313.1 hypothetical protein [Planctomycetota bacterium]